MKQVVMKLYTAESGNIKGLLRNGGVPFSEIHEENNNKKISEASFFEKDKKWY